jgi:colanic acid biosynthesis glycosyl transferase WcaI
VKILFLTENFPPETNASATRVFERACYWAKWGHEVTVLTSAPNFPRGKLMAGYRNHWKQVETRGGMRVVRVKTFIAANQGVVLRSLDFLSFMVSAGVAGLFEEKPDLVVATSPQFFAAVGGWALAKARDVPFVFELGDLWPASIAAVGAMRQSAALRVMERLELFLYRESACVVALTHAFKANLQERGIPGDKIAVVINGVDLGRYAPTPRDPKLAAEWDLTGKFVIGYVGTHGMAHALANVLEAAERLRDHDDLRFMLVGSGAERSALMAAARRRKLNNVIFVSPQPKEAMPAVWSLCDVALVHLKDEPAFREVIPSKMFEAMAMGLPLLLASPDGEARQILEADKAGLWVPAEDPAVLAAAALRLMQKSDERERFARASLAAAPLHSREYQARQMIGVLEAVAAGDGARVGVMAAP